MNIEQEKKRIISEIKNVEDEWVILAIKKLLDIDEMPSHHRQVIEDRLAEYKNSKDSLQDWESIKDDL